MFGSYRYELYENKKLVETYSDDISLRWFGQYEFKMLLEKVGYKNIKNGKKNVKSVHGNSFVFFADK